MTTASRPLTRTACRTCTASNHPQRRGRPVTAPNSWPFARSASPSAPVNSDRERPFAHARRVGLGDAEHGVHRARADAEARARAADGRVRRGDVRVGPVVEIEHRALGALEQDRAPLRHRPGQRDRHVADPRPQPRAERPRLRRARPRQSQRLVAWTSGCGGRRRRGRVPRAPPRQPGRTRAGPAGRPCPRRPARCRARWCRSSARRGSPRSAGRGRGGTAG